MAGIQFTSIQDEGFTVLSEGTDPIVDIILVHGLHGHPKATWTSQAVPLSRTGVSKRCRSCLDFLWLCGRRNGGEDAGESEILIEPTEPAFWPADFLPTDVPNARIVTYGYDSAVASFLGAATGQGTVYQHAEDMLVRFGELRVGCETRPIIFIAHSLGGILVKDVLRRSKAAAHVPEARSIFAATRAILFLGTPHRASSYATWAELARRIASAALADTTTMQVDSSELERLREEFSNMLSDPRMKIYSFQEAKGLLGARGVKRKVVENASSALDDPAETKVTINANHVNMCRFASEGDSGYRDVVWALGICVKVVEGDVEAQKEDM